MKKDRFGSASFRLKAGLRTFRFWRWLIRFIVVIGAATLPRQVSPGMVKRREKQLAPQPWPHPGRIIFSKTKNAGLGSKAAPRQGVIIPKNTYERRAAAAAKNYFGSFSARWANCQYKLMEK